MSGNTAAAADALADIAVVGLAGRFPGAADAAALWENLRRGVESISFWGRDELARAGTPPELLAEPAFVGARGVVAGIELFDAALFGISPREAQIMDPQQRLFLECAWEALDAAGCDPERFAGAIGVYAGVSQSSYFLANLATHPELLAAVAPLELRIGNDKDFVATHTSYRLNLRGPSVTVATACSSSLVAVHFACQALLNRECDLALAGGASLAVPQVQGYLYQPGGIVSADGHCRAFDAAASGSVGGDGVGIVALKRLADALAARDAIHAVIKGSAINNDGAGKIGFTAPSVEGQAAVIAEAQSAAGVEPATVTYVEAHGSGTPLGDPVEVRALTRAFRAGTGRRGFCKIGSVKTNLGHLDSAAGIAGLIKTVLALEHRLIPPSLHCASPNPAVPWAETPFTVAAAAEPWESPAGPRRAGVNSFGIGGTNAHVVLEEAPPAAASGPSRPWQLVVLSAASAAAVERAAGDLASWLGEHPEAPLADAAHAGRVGRKALRHRRALVCRDRDDARAALAARDPARLLASDDPIAGRGVAFLLPGVGDHYPGMASGLYRDEPVFRREVDRCAEILAPLLGCDLRLVLCGDDAAEAAGAGAADGSSAGAAALGGGSGKEAADGSGEGTAAPGGEGQRQAGAPAAAAGLDLRRMLGRGVAGGEGAGGAAAGGLERTEILQPAVFVVEYALARLWETWGVRPRALLGYSLGELAAACLAGVMSLADALRLVAWRAARIAELPAGAMLAVPLAEEDVAVRLARQEPALGGALGGAGLSVAAVNGPELVVVAGAPAAVAAFAAELAADGITCRRVPATHAFHSGAMEPLAAPLAGFLGGIELRPPRIPLVTGVTGGWISDAQATDAWHWARQLCQPVRFAAGLAVLCEEPATCLLEVGPGHGLATLARQQGGSGGRVAIPSLRPVYDSRADQAFLLEAAARLWLAGVELDWTAFAAGERRNKVRLPAYPFSRERYWIEPRAGRTAAELHAGAGVAVVRAAALVDSADTAEVADAAESAPVDAAAPGAALHARPALRTPYVAPVSAHEVRLAAIWQELLKIATVGVHDSFFELGGNSLLAPRVLLAVRHAWGIEVPLARLLAEPTVERLARAVEELAGTAEAAPPAAGNPSDALAAAGGDTSLALAAEVVLAPPLVVVGEPAGDLADPGAVLLTGASGFLGAFLLRDLLQQTRARVHCLVRARDAAEGRAKIVANLAAHHLGAAAAGAAAERIVAVPGDLARERWGLAEAAWTALAAEVEAVYHGGAWVNFTYPYALLKPANVAGTETALRLAATGRPKPLHFISSIAVFPPGALAGGVGWEDCDLADPAGLAGGYAQSKWVAERLVDLARRQGVCATVHRPGLIGGDAATGVGNPRDLLWAFLKGCIEMGAAPDLPSRFDPAPVDFVSRAIVRLSRRRASLGRAFHYVHPRPLAWREVFAFAAARGHALRIVPPAVWDGLLAAELARADDNALFPFRSLLEEAAPPAGDPVAGLDRAAGVGTAAGMDRATGAALALAASPRFDAANTWAGLAGSGIVCPPLDEERLGIWFAHLEASGFLPRPAAVGA